MKTVYIADDGTQFDSFDECHQYENSAERQLSQLIAELIGNQYNDDCGRNVIEECHVYDFIVTHIDTINKILKKTDEPDSSGWISNIGNDTITYPPTISGGTKVCVKYRDGKLETCLANYHDVSWTETDGTMYDIVAYRII